jgi:hypothetical protein
MRAVHAPRVVSALVAIAANCRPGAKRRQRSLELGADELVGRCEWAFRKKPRTLRRLRAAYVALCLRLYRALERSRP